MPHSPVHKHTIQYPKKMKTSLYRSLTSAAVALLCLVSAPFAGAQTGTVEPRKTAGLMHPENPTCLLIGYDAKPESRAAFHKYLRGEGLKQLEAWKAAGKLQKYQIVFQNFDECNEGPDAILILTFEKFVDSYKWVDVEIENPSGLTPAGQKLAQARYSVLAENIATRDVGNEDPSATVFEVSVYDTTKDKVAYKKFVAEYPQAMFENWIGQGAVAEYSVYVPMQPYGHPWDSMIILGYKNATAHAGSAKVKVKSYADLAGNVAYNTQLVTRDTMRTKVGEVFYHPIVAK